MISDKNNRLSSQLRRISFLALIITGVVVLDQWTKYLVVNKMLLDESIEIISGFFYLTHIHNYGVAFGMFSRLTPAFRSVIMVGLPTLIFFFLLMLYFWRDFQNKVTTCALALVISGAIGNLMDRYAQGYVVDFLDVNLGFMRWPAFNVADSCVTVGAVLLMIYFTFWHKPTLEGHK